jgi:murein DD-endopeptidase MepM/ murein hydrolase activator NlpD
MQKVSLLILSNTGTRTRQISLPSLLFRGLVLVGVACLLGIGYFIFDYQQVKIAYTTSKALEQKISEQQDLISGQQVQIQNFASEINKLKAQLVTLNNFEDKIRIIANLKHLDEQDGLFGVGGSIPEDLVANTDLNHRKSALIRDMHDQIALLEVASDNQKKGFTSLLKALEGQKNLLACTPAIRPTKGWKSSRFGYRISPFTGRREFHKGLDIANQNGTPIIAPANGLVKFVGKKGFMGNTLIIDHGHGLVTRYGHLGKTMKKRGEKVNRGDSIALMGNTGRSTGPHLHYEIQLNGVPVNPEKYILN